MSQAAADRIPLGAPIPRFSLSEPLTGRLLGPADFPQARAILVAFLANACSFQHTSAALGVHRNTVLQRIRRCESELGRPVTSTEPELTAALMILDWLPAVSSRG